MKATKPEKTAPSDSVRRIVMRKCVLLLTVLWMIPWYLLAQILKILTCFTAAMQNLWWHPIDEARDSWDSNA